MKKAEDCDVVILHSGNRDRMLEKEGLKYRRLITICPQCGYHGEKKPYSFVRDSSKWIIPKAQRPIKYLTYLCQRCKCKWMVEYDYDLFVIAMNDAIKEGVGELW